MMSTPTLLQFFGKQNQDVARDLNRALDQQEPPFTEKRSVRLKTPDGNWMDVDLTIDATAADGKTEACLTFIETTEFRRTVRQHHETMLNFKGLIESSAVALAVVGEGRDPL